MTDEETVEAYHRLMGLLRDAQGSHGCCTPRSRRACTTRNAKDDIVEMVEAYKGRPPVLSTADKSEQPPT